MATRPFIVRTKEPEKDNKYWFSNDNGYYAAGLGPKKQSDGSYYYYSSAFKCKCYGNCTWYAYGRMYELMGEKPGYSCGTPAAIWDSPGSKLEKISDPVAGCLAICGTGSGASHHIAVVEEIKSGTEARMSESAATSSGGWFYKKDIPIYKQSDGRWTYYQYTITGFLKPKNITFEGQGTSTYTSADISSWDGIYALLREQGLAHEYACGVMANLAYETTGGSLNSLPQPTMKAWDTNDQYSYGICQWQGNRYLNLQNYTQNIGVSWDSLFGQLCFLVHEFGTTYNSSWTKCVRASSDADFPSNINDSSAGYGGLGYTVKLKDTDDAVKSMGGAGKFGYAMAAYYEKSAHFIPVGSTNNNWANRAKLAETISSKYGQYETNYSSLKGSIGMTGVDGPASFADDSISSSQSGWGQQLLDGIKTAIAAGGAIAQFMTGDWIDAILRTAPTYENQIQEVTTTVTKKGIVTVDEKLNRTKGTSLLSYPSLVETPFVYIELPVKNPNGKTNYMLGAYRGRADNKKSGTNAGYWKTLDVVDSISVVKVNGTVNQYTIKLIYQIEAGQDPNFIDKLLGKIGYGLINISYGDYSTPAFQYKKENALITKVSSNVDFASSRITYTIHATSNAVKLSATCFDFKAKEKANPVNEILALFRDNKYGLSQIFDGMDTETKILSNNLLPSSSSVQSVKLERKERIDPLSYINYLVSCMVSTTSDKNSLIRDSSYILTLHDDIYMDTDKNKSLNLGGAYFRVTKIKADGKTISTEDTYEVDIGYPGNPNEDGGNLVTSFNINNDNSWALIYDYSTYLSPKGSSQNAYRINSDGTIVTKPMSDVIATTNYTMENEKQKAWWTKMTQFPISATLEIKGLVKPAMMTQYLRINAFFYGQRHISSGLYIITRQEDRIDARGFRTVLGLTRVAGDQDFIQTKTYEVTSRVAYAVKTADGTVKDSNGSNKKPTYNDTVNKRQSDLWKEAEKYGGGTNGYNVARAIAGDHGYYDENAIVSPQEAWERNKEIALEKIKNLRGNLDNFLP